MSLDSDLNGVGWTSNKNSLPGVKNESCSGIDLRKNDMDKPLFDKLIILYT